MERSSVSARPLPWLRWGLYAALGAAGVPLYLRILGLGARVSTDGTPFLWPGLGVTAIAMVIALLVWATPPAATRAQRWIELGVLLAVGIALRALFLGAAPAISHDAYRYVWDAHLVAHGVSPYAHAVDDPALASLRDGAIWPNVNWRDSPTIYPPGAQVFFLLVHAIAPLNIWAMKWAIELCDVATGLVTLLLLRQFGMDPRRVVLYWWNPIPVLEFAYSAHVDALATLGAAVALLLATRVWRSARPFAGLALGVAALTKLFPLLFVLALARRRDWRLLAGLILALVGLSLPFVALGLGGGGFLSTYFAQRFVDQGIVFHLIDTLVLNRVAQVALLGLTALALCAGVLWLRHRGALGPVGAILALSAVWIAVSPHLFPWYVASLLPFLALCLRLPGRVAGGVWAPAWALWLFALAAPFTYVIFTSGQTSGLFVWFFIVPGALAFAPSAPYVVRALRRLSLGMRAQWPFAPVALRED